MNQPVTSVQTFPLLLQVSLFSFFFFFFFFFRSSSRKIQKVRLNKQTFLRASHTNRSFFLQPWPTTSLFSPLYSFYILFFSVTSPLAFSPLLSSVSPSSARSTSSQFSLLGGFPVWRLSSGISLFPLHYFYPSLPFFWPPSLFFPLHFFFLLSSSSSTSLSLSECVSSLRGRGSDYSGSLWGSLARWQ